MNFTIFRVQGVVDAINHENGDCLPWNYDKKKFDKEDDPLVIEFRKWAKENNISLEDEAYEEDKEISAEFELKDELKDNKRIEIHCHSKRTLEEKINALSQSHFKILELLQQNVELTKEANDTPEMLQTQEIIKVLSQAVKQLSFDFSELKIKFEEYSKNGASNSNSSSTSNNLSNAAIAETVTIKIPQLISKDSSIKPLEIELFGSFKYINGVFETIGNQWNSGFRSILPIETPGDYFQYKLNGIGIIGVTPFPKASTNWKGTDWANYHTSSTAIRQFINDAYTSSAIAIEVEQTMRFALDKDKYLLWQTVEKDNSIKELFKSATPLTSGVFLFCTPALKTTVFDLKIGKTNLNI